MSMELMLSLTTPANTLESLQKVHIRAKQIWEN